MSITSRPETTKVVSSELQARFRFLWKQLGVELRPGQHGYRCPFHDDRSPSLSINAELGVWQCWAESCGQAGDVKGLDQAVSVYRSRDGYQGAPSPKERSAIRTPSIWGPDWGEEPSSSLNYRGCGVLVLGETHDGRLTLVQAPCKSRRCAYCRPRVDFQTLVRYSEPLTSGPVYRVVVPEEDYAALNKRIRRLKGGGYAMPAGGGTRIVYNTEVGEMVANPEALASLMADLAARVLTLDDGSPDRRRARAFGTWRDYRLHVAKAFKQVVPLLRNILSGIMPELLTQRFGTAVRAFVTRDGRRKWTLREDITIEAALTLVPVPGTTLEDHEEPIFRAWKAARRRLRAA